MPPESHSQPGPIDQIEALGLALLAYAKTGKDKPAPERAQEARWLLAAISTPREGASDQVKDELARAILDLRGEGWTLKKIAEWLQYKSISRLDQIVKGYTGTRYEAMRHPARGGSRTPRK